MIQKWLKRFREKQDAETDAKAELENAQKSGSV